MGVRMSPIEMVHRMRDRLMILLLGSLLILSCRDDIDTIVPMRIDDGTIKNILNKSKVVRDISEVPLVQNSRRNCSP